MPLCICVTCHVMSCIQTSHNFLSARGRRYTSSINCDASMLGCLAGGRHCWLVGIVWRRIILANINKHVDIFRGENIPERVFKKKRKSATSFNEMTFQYSRPCNFASAALGSVGGDGILLRVQYAITSKSFQELTRQLHHRCHRSAAFFLQGVRANFRYFPCYNISPLLLIFLDGTIILLRIPV